MKNCTNICLLTTVIVCSFFLFSSCSNTIAGRYIGDLEFSDRNSSYSSLVLKQDKTFTLRHESISLENEDASTAVTETKGTYKMNFNNLVIETTVGRTGEINYRLDDLKTYRVLFSGTSIPLDTYKMTRLIIPVDTVYSEFHIYDETEKIKFKKIKSNNSIYFITDGAIFSKKIKSGKDIDTELDCPNLYEINRGADNTY